MTETGKVFLRYLYKRFGWKVIHHRKKLFRIIHKRAFETSMKKLKFVIFTNAPCKGLNSNTKKERRWRDLNPRTGCPACRISSAVPSASWVHLHIKIRNSSEV